MKKILLMLFFTGLLKAGAQENRFEISLGAGPSYAKDEKPKAGIMTNGKLGYKVNNVLTMFIGAEYISFPVKDISMSLPPQNDSLGQQGGINRVEMVNGKGSMIMFFGGGRVNILSQNLFSPYLTSNIGLFSIEKFYQDKPTLKTNPNFSVDEVDESSFPGFMITVGGGINLNIASDKILFAEISVQGGDIASFTSAIIGTRICF